MLYRILKLIVAIGIRLYYRKIKVVNEGILDESGPRIFIANHPNTLMDAWIIGHITRRPIYFMAKATLFSNPFKQKILRSLNMIPINRKGEGVIDGVSNQDSFEACYRILEEGKCLLVFPEGSSFLERHLRELKSGTARIALETERRNDNKLNLKVVPIGLNYMMAERFRSDVLVRVGTPIEVADYAVEKLENVSQAAKKLTERFRMRLEQVLVNSHEPEEEELTDSLYTILSSKYLKQEGKGVEAELKLLKEIRDRIAELNLTQAWKISEIRKLQESIKWKLDRYEIRADFLDRRFRSRMFLRQLSFSIIGFILGLPLFLFGLIHNLLQYKLTDFLVPKITKEVEYYAPLAVLVGLITYPLFYTAFLMTMNHFLDLNWMLKWVYFISMPVSGLFTYYLYRYFQHISFKWRFIFLWMNDKEELVKLKTEKEELRSLIFEV